MATRAKGHNAVGRNKIFRAAVEEVHVGVGHAVLGNVALRLAVGSAETAHTPHTALYEELNAQLLANSAKEFKQLRWEILEWCETPALFAMHQLPIAEKLISKLLDRRGGSFSASSTALARSRAAAATSSAVDAASVMERGALGEGFEAFVRLTVAFARDCGDRFLPFFEAFHQAVNAGIYDKQGALIADTATLQLIYAAQVAWCRELSAYWELPEHHAIVGSILRIYLRQLCDTKEYVRRLTAEVLAFLCRQHRPLLRYVVEEACAMVLETYSRFVEESAAGASSMSEASAMEQDGEEVVDGPNNAAEENEDEDEARTTSEEMPSPQRLCGTAETCRRFTADSLSVHPVVDGLTFFVAELFRGMQGSLSSSFELHYYAFLRSFLLLPSVKTVQQLRRLTRDESLLTAILPVADEEEVVAVAAEAMPMRGIASSGAWAWAFDDEASDDVEGAERRTTQEVIRHVGLLCMGGALQRVLHETKKHSASREDDDSDDSHDDDEDKDVHHVGAADARPSHRLLQAVLGWLQPADPLHLRLLLSITQTADGLLWRDAKERHNLGRALTSIGAACPNASPTHQHDVDDGTWQTRLDWSAAVMELLLPLCFSIYRDPQGHLHAVTSDSPGGPTLNAHQKAALPVGRAVCAYLVRLACPTAEAPAKLTNFLLAAEAAQRVLCGYVQDVLQKHYHLALAEERRLGEEEDLQPEDEDEDGNRGVTAPTSRVVSSALTPLALTLLHGVCTGMWGYAGELLADDVAPSSSSRRKLAPSTSARSSPMLDVLHQRTVERALLLARLANDRTRHMRSCPLAQLLRLKTSAPAAAKPRRSSGKESATTETSAGVELWQSLRAMVQHLATAMVGHLGASNEHHHSTLLVEPAYTARLLSCAVPLIYTLVGNGRRLAEVAQLRQVLSEVIAAIQDPSSSASTHATRGRRNTVDTLTLSTANYDLYAHITAILVHLTTTTTTTASSGSSQGAATDVTSEEQRTAALNHLCRTISLLAVGFEGLHTSTNEAVDVQPLLSGTERLLESLGWFVGLHTAMDGAQTSHKQSLTAGMRAAVLLRSSLPVEVQRSLVSVILPEALSSPVQALRVAALRLLRLLCQPAIAETRGAAFLEGLAAVEPVFFDRLIRAEEYNPLSSSGNLDGMQQALASVVFAAEAGTMVEPLPRVLLARAMMGLLHMKFSGAWPIATRILAALLRREGGASTTPTKDEDRDEAEEVPTAAGRRLDPLVWEKVVRPLARRLTFGDESSTSVKRNVVGDELGAGTSSAEEVAEELTTLEGVPTYYLLRLSDQQRYEMGEASSKRFALTAYHATTSTLLHRPTEDGELMTWAHYQRAAVSLTSAASTDAATVAQTFLQLLAEVMSSTRQPTDAKVVLVEELLTELASVARHDHPTMLQLRRVEDRLHVAMQACAQAPTIVLSAARLQRRPPAEAAALTRRAHELTSILLPFLSSSNARLQRATLDNLKRLKLEPFLTHHAHLTPYTDPSKALFAFLNTFHVESDVPAHSAVNYICAAFSVALPKLIGTVSKEKMRDQVMLRRRMMSFVAHLSTHNGSAAVEEVLAKLVDQIVFARIRTMPDGASDDGGDGHHSVWCNKAWMAELNFLETWSDSLTDRRRHPIRRLEHQVKQLISAIQLLESLLHAVGKKFSVFIAPCLHLVLQAYLLASKDQLRRPLLAQMEAATAAEDEAALAYFRPLLRTLDQHGGLTNALAPLRRASITVAALLFEQFPEESMAAVRADVAASPSTSEALLGRYLRALVANSKGITLRAASSSSAMLAAASSSRRGGGASGVAKAQVTPVLRLMTAWVQAPELLPLMPAFAEEVLATLEEVFATNTAASGGASVHRAASATIYQGLRLVADVLSLGEVEVELLASADESAVKKKKKVATSTSALPTLRTVFLKPYVERIFATLYRLIMCGSASERQEAARSSSSRALSAKKNTVMRFSVAMWREIMQTVSKLVQHIAIVGTSSALQTMMERLLDISLQFVSHPLCAADASTAKMAVDVVLHLAEELPTIDSRRHVSALAHLLNAVTAPAARKTLCEVVRVMAAKMEVVECVARYGEGATTEAYTAQLHTTARVVECLNRFTTDDQYDYDLRFHTFNALLSFFARGREGAEHHPPTTRRAKKASAQEAAVRRERAYAGAEDVALPVSAAAPVLCVEALHLIAANLMFFLRDAEATIRGLAQQVLQAMLAYAGGSTQTNTKTKKTEDKEDEGSDYATLILHEVVRREVLPSLRRGSVARDVRIRQLHLASFGALAQHFPSSFPSFRVLYATNPADSFYANVIHVMPSARLHALAILRREAAHLQVRDVLRVFVPFLLSAVKDFATGKRQLENMSEGRERGYCEAVLLTIASLCEHLPWEAYYRVLSLFLANASANAALRMPMLRGVVQVLSHFRFLEEEAEKEKSGGVPSRAAATTHDDDDDDENDDDEEDVEDEDEAVRAEMQSKRRLYHRAKVMRVLEDDIIPQLYGYIGQGKKNSGGLGELKGSNANTISSVRREQAKEDAGATKNALLQLPVAVAIVKIVRHFPDERFTFHTEFLMNEVVQKLRTKNDKHRESARRILAAMLQETGPSKLGFVVRKLKDNLVHGYQLHVLGYTVVTLLMQLYEPERAAMDGRSSHSSKHARKLSSATITGLDPVQEALGGEPPRQQRRHDKATTTTTRKNAEAEADADAIVEQQEEDFLEELLSRHGAIRFDREEGVRYLTHIMDDLMLIFLDDYLGEVGMQKEQVELMSTMVEVKRNRALQGFSFLGTHCEAGPVLEAFLHRITWVLTPPSDTTVDVHDLHGSARARALIMRELRSKYMTISKNAGADLVFVNKVRSLAIRVARSLLSNPTMEVDASFAQVRDLLQRHNTVRAEKIEAFEAKDGTRRIRGNAHVLIHCAERRSWKELLDRTYAVAPVPERVDVDFSAHTVLATQQKQKLRVYRGLYGKEVRAAAKDFYRDDPTTAVVLDTLDEFLLRYLLSVLKQVLGIGKERRYSKAALKLDLVRHHHKSATAESEDDEAEEDEEASHNDDEEDEEDEEVGDEEDGGAPLDSLAPRSIGADEGDELDDFADAQVAMDEAEAVAAARGNQSSSKKASKHTATFSVAQGTDLAATFTREHRTLLESLVPTVLSTLEGEGSDAVVATALDCLLALISLRPPLDAVHELESSLFDTITSYFGRGGPIKQRAMRVCSALVSQQKFVLAESHASQLIKIIRAEMMDRSSFLPMALSLLYAILGKHVHVVEIYNLMDLITEMLIHLASKRIIRTRCIVILVRFLMEYRLTPDKFRSHIDLICRNLDFPELGGRLALLDLIHALVERLPSAVLRSEAPVLLLPLAATLQSAEWPACRERAGVVLQQLVRCAGIDVLQPLLATWMDPSSPRSTKTNAMQVWATFLPAIAKAYGLPQPTPPTLGEDDEAESSYAACCTWSVEAVLHGCGVGTAEASCALPAQAKAKAEMKSWMLHYFGLRCAEAMIEAAPATFVPLLMPTLLPVVERWVLHSHAWIQAAALRILRLYCYNYVEPRCHYLASSVMPVVEMACARRGGATTNVVETEEAESMPFLLPQLRIAEDGRVRGSIPFTERALQAVMSLVKHLLNRLTSCDVADEKYHAHRAMDDPARAESLKVLVFLTKAAMQLSGVLVLLSGRPSSSSASRHYAHTTAVVQRHMEQLRRQLHSLAAPIIKQQHINNYMVRSATLIQYCGGLISVLPLPHGEEEEESSPTSAVLHEDVARTEKWLVQDGLHALELARSTVVPLLLVGLGTSADTSVKIANYAHQASQVVRQQLEARRALFQPTSSSSTSRSGSKRQREEMEEVSLEAVLSSLTVGLSGLKEEAARQRVSAEARKMLKRNRHATKMAIVAKKTAAKSSSSSSASSTKRTRR